MTTKDLPTITILTILNRSTGVTFTERAVGDGSDRVAWYANRTHADTWTILSIAPEGA